MLVTFPKAFSRVSTFQGQFPKVSTSQMCNNLTIGNLLLGRLHFWEVVTWEDTFWKIPNTKRATHIKVNTYLDPNLEYLPNQTADP